MAPHPRGPGGSRLPAHTAPPPLLTRGTPEAARSLAAGLSPPLPGVRGDSEAAWTFAEAWRDRTGAAVRAERALRVYRLGALTPRLPGPPGRPRTAGPADRELLLTWQREFAEELGEPNHPGERLVDDALAYGGRLLWEVDGAPVAMAGSTAPADGAIRVVDVYTPKGLRGRGYAGAATAAVSRAALDAGAGDVILFADLANPVSTGLYQRLGYVPVRDHVTLSFTDPDPSSPRNPCGTRDAAPSGARGGPGAAA